MIKAQLNTALYTFQANKNKYKSSSVLETTT